MFAEEFFFAQLAVELFSEVRCEGVEDAEEIEEEILRDFFRFGVGVDAFHHGGDGGVEAESFDVFADFLDGGVGEFWRARQMQEHRQRFYPGDATPLLGNEKHLRLLSWTKV